MPQNKKLTNSIVAVIKNDVKFPQKSISQHLKAFLVISNPPAECVCIVQKVGKYFSVYVSTKQRHSESWLTTVWLCPAGSGSAMNVEVQSREDEAFVV